MLRLGTFGNKETFIQIFDDKKFNHNERENIILRKDLQEYLLNDSWLSYVHSITSEFRKTKTEFLETTSLKSQDRLQYIKWNIEYNQDLLYCLSFCIPGRHIKDERFRYDTDKVAKRTNQLEYDILNHINDLQRIIIEILLGKENYIYSKKFSLPKKFIKSMPIENTREFVPIPILPKIEPIPILPKIELKKRGFFSWLK